VVALTALLFALRGRRRYLAWVIGGGSYAAIAVGVIWIIERSANVSLLRFQQAAEARSNHLPSSPTMTASKAPRTRARKACRL